MQVQQISQTLKDKGIKFVFAQSVDMAGIPRAKLVPIEHLEDLAPPDGGAFFAGFAAYGMGQGPHEPDLASIPDWETLTILPWKKDTARFACDVYFEGKPWRYCARTILKNVLAKLDSAGYRADIGVEPEFYLVKRTDRGVEPFDPDDTMDRPCYDMRGISRSLQFLQNVITNMQELGWDVYAIDHEDANAQFEIDLHYADALTTCDRYVFFRYMLSMMAHEIGAIACFMAKPWSNKTGSGAHFHINLADATSGDNLFLSDTDDLGLSELAYHFIGGLLAHAPAYTALTAPTVNSYKRLVSVAPISGATWAPVAIAYGGNNRTQMLRVPGPGRVENRAVDSTCNPYLAAAGVLAAGLDGIERKLSPGERNDLNIYDADSAQLSQRGIKMLPSNLKEALENLAGDDVIRRAIGEEFADYYVDLKMQEWSEYHNTVSQWEIDHYLTTF